LEGSDKKEKRVLTKCSGRVFLKTLEVPSRPFKGFLKGLLKACKGLQKAFKRPFEDL
jgi:hypothetical protein